MGVNARERAIRLFGERLEAIRAEGLWKDERVIASPQGGRVRVRPEDREILNLCSNNYLGLSSHPEVIRAAREALDTRGYGMSSVRFICGTQDLHRELEREIAAFLGFEEAVLFGSCFDANAALFETLLCEEDAVFSDRLVHASLIDGMRLSKARRIVYEHSDMGDLSRKLAEASQARIKMIVTDGVFSMDGAMARLDEIVALAENHGSLLAVDDSHATGFIGRTGRGTHEKFGVMGRVDIVTTTFGKALGGATGGCIAARREIVELFRQRARPYLFSNALMPAVAAATSRALGLLSGDTERRDRLESLTAKWRSGLSGLGFDLKPGDTPIVPVMLYDAQLAARVSRDLYSEGVYAVGFSFPVVPRGEARIRTQMSAALAPADLDRALAAFERVGKKYEILGLGREGIVEAYGANPRWP